MKEIHIAIAADSNYLIPVTVVLQSIFDNSRKSTISFYLLYMTGTMEQEKLEFLSAFTTKHRGKFIPLEINPDQLADFPETRHGKATLLRLCLPTVLPDLDKILYLDGDVIVNDDLTELYSTDITGYYLAAAKDSATAYDIGYQKAMGIEEEHCYFNAGVTLLNLKELRQIQLQEIISRIVERDYLLIGAPDQDALNYICQKGKTYYIPPRYNMNYNLEKDIANKIWGKQAIKEAKQNPAIIHYIGPIKPWSILSTHPQGKLWWAYLRRTPFAGFRPKDATLKNRLRKVYLSLTKPIEAQFSLKSKQQIGKLIPSALKKHIKKSLLKPQPKQ